MNNNDRLAARFMAEMSERQISVREFFSVDLLEALQRDFGLNNAAIFIFDTEGKFLSWVTKDGVQVTGPNHAYAQMVDDDKMRQVIYEEAVRDELTYFNHSPRIYRASDYYVKKQYDRSRFVNVIEKEFHAHYAASLALGINAYIQITFFKSLEEGDYSDAEMEELQDIYQYIAIAYAGFKKHEQSKIISNIQDEIIRSGEQAYLITDEFMHVLSFNKEAISLMVNILGKTVADQIENGKSCLWLPFLLDGGKTIEGEPVVTKEIRNYIFKIYTYDQNYQHGIVDRYHWITISEQETVERKSARDIRLSPSERKVADLLCEGLTYQQIADELCISYHTVKNHVQHIFSKYEVSNRYELYKVLK